jgi:nitroreductase
MPILDLSIDTLLTTTRSVRKRLELALQTPTPSNSQGWHFVVVTDPEPRQALAMI